MQKYSVALACFNGENYIADQLTSILNQSLKPSEIIISDDGSSDKTVEICESILSQSGVAYQILHNSIEHGVVGNFTNAISNCKNEIIFTSDQDDIWYKSKAIDIISKFEDNKSTLLIFTDGDLVDGKLQTMNCSIWDAVGLSHKTLSENKLFNIMIKNCVVTGATMAFRKDLLKKSLPLPNEWLHDGWLSWVALLNNGLYGYDKKLIAYRQHNKNTVGMDPKKSIFQRITSWYERVDMLASFRKDKLISYQCLLTKGNRLLSKYQQKQIGNCVDFWQALSDMDNKTLFKKLGIVNLMLFKGYYHRFYNGFRGYLGDLIYIFRNSKINVGLPISHLD